MKMNFMVLEILFCGFGKVLKYYRSNLYDCMQQLVFGWKFVLLIILISWGKNYSKLLKSQNLPGGSEATGPKELS